MVVGAIASLQCGSALSTTLFDRLGVSGTNFLRMATGAALLCLLARPLVRVPRRSDLALLLGFGIIVALASVAFYNALDRLPLGITVAIEFTGPLAVAVLSSRRRLDLAWAALAGLGVLLLSGALQGGDVSTAGLAFAALSAVCWAAYILVGQRVGRRFPGSAALSSSTVLAALLLAPAGIAEAGGALLDPLTLLEVAGIGLISVAVPILFEVTALRTLPARVYGILTSIEPALAALAGLVLLDQRLGGLQAVAIGFVVIASVGAAQGATAVPGEL